MKCFTSIAEFSAGLQVKRHLSDGGSRLQDSSLSETCFTACQIILSAEKESMKRRAVMQSERQ